jgi:predicted Ser/Thr protein kinase
MREGDLIAGRYRVVRRAGAGGMGAVYEGYDTAAAVPVALKTLRGDVGGDERARARLKYEAKALREIDHPAVVRYVDHGIGANDEPFLVMEWIAGETLGQHLRAAGVTPDQALGLVERLAGGLAAVHGHGVVHRDLKPSNVILHDGDVARAVLVDFGVARVRHTTGGVRLTGDRLGTPRYMAPEQIRGARDVDGKADIFALGCILYECLTGRRTFVGPDAVTVLARILFEPPPAPSAVDPRLSTDLDALVADMMDHDTGRRLTATSVVERAGAARRAATPSSEPRRVVAISDQGGDIAPPVSGGTLPMHSAPIVRPDLATSEARLTALIDDGARVVSVWGRAGAGKTALVERVVGQIDARPARPWDAVFSVRLAAAKGPDDAARSVAAQAGVPLDASAGPQSAVALALARMGRVLLVLDAIDPIADALVAVAQTWTAAAPRLRVLATSRARWSVPGADAIEVGPPVA